MSVHGIDVSHHQGRIDWSAVAGDGISYMIAKASEGTSFVDDQFHRNWDRAQAAGLLAGGYHFLHPGDGAAQARHYLSVLGGRTDGLVVVDVERTGSGGLPTAADTAEFVAEIRRHLGPDQSIGVYTGGWYWRGVLGDPDMAGLGVWLWNSHYVSGSGSWRELVGRVPRDWLTDRVGGLQPSVLQYSSSGAVPGIAGRCDLDLHPGDLASLHDLAGEETMTPEQFADILRHPAVRDAILRYPRGEGISGAGQYSRTNLMILRRLVGDVGALKSTVQALAERGGLDAAEVQAAAEAGARAALAELGETLSGGEPT